jgi:orotate phosphoribosyltransferase
LRRAGAVVDTVLCVIDRLSGAKEAFAEKGLTLQSLFTKDDLDEVRTHTSESEGPNELR